MRLSSPRAGEEPTGSLPSLQGLARQFFEAHPEISKNTEQIIVARIEARLPEVAGRIVQEISERVPAYASIDDANIAAHAVALLQAVVEHAKTDALPGRGLLEPFEQHAERRTFDGVPLDALLQAIHIGARELIAVLDEEFQRADMPIEGMLQMRDLAWEWANGIMSTMARLHGELEQQRVRRERARRTEFVRHILLGTHPPEGLRTGAGRFGLAVDRAYVPFCCRPAGRREALDIAAEILRTGAHDGLAPIVETLDGDLVGLSPARPHVTGHLVAVGDPMVLEQVHASFADACAALEAAHAFDMRGTLTLEDLGPRPLVVAAERAADRLDRRLLAALPEGPEPGEIERTTLDYLAHDQDAEGTASRMCVHVNTVRYRLGRFRELTGLDLRRTEDLVAAWWLLQRRAAGRREQLGASPPAA